MRKPLVPVLVLVFIFLCGACMQQSASPAVPEATKSCAGTLAFVSDKSGRPQIYSMNCAGGEWAQLTTDAHDNYAPTWSPDGTRIALYKHFSWQSWAIFIMDADGGNPQQITPDDGSVLCGSAPSWSPDGTQLLFMVESSNQPTCEMKSTDIALINIDGTGYRRLTDSAEVEIARGWSPDGSRIVYYAMEAGGAAIWMMDADGSDPVQLTDASANNVGPVISPDGGLIVFQSDRSGSDQLYVMNIDGSQVRQLTTEASDYNWPAWSPDGSQVLFSAGNFRRAEVDLYVVNVDGTGLEQITDAPGLEYEASWTAAESTP